METKISNSVVATGKSTISKATIKVNQDLCDNESSENATTKNSVVAQDGSKITDVAIVTKEKRKSFWRNFSIGSIIASVVACAIWYFIQKLIE
ncbi:MAG: hypothetical protein LBL07_03730 [Tannerella sp.]|jgi:hypothetical protein|nr:hypothetical protein [Tannerella sp.]